jgi:autotransporter-associated beta strand protein
MKTIRSNQLPSLMLAALLLGGLATQAQTLTWRGTAGDLLWTNALNWDPNNAPASANALLFDNIGGFTNTLGAVNNIMDLDTTVSSVQFSASAVSGNYHTTEIRTNRTLSIAGTGTSPLLFVGTTDNTSLQIAATMTGGGNLAVGNLPSPMTTTSIHIGQRYNSGGAQRGTLDLSGLDSFTAGVGWFYVGGNGIATLYRDQGTLYLAKTNVIRAVGTDTTVGYGAFRVAHNVAAGGAGSYLYLGQENSIYTGWMRLGGSRASSPGAVVQFKPGWVSPTLKLRGADMVSRMGTLGVADGYDSGGSTAIYGTLDLTGGTVDGMITTLIIGRNSVNASSTGPAVAIMTFDAGTVNASTVNLGCQLGANNTAKSTGTLNVNGTASLIAGTLNIGMDNGTGTGFGTGTLNINGGSVLVTGNVVENNATGGNGSSTINFTGAWGTMKVNGSMTLDNLNLDVATATLQAAGAIKADSLNLTAGTLQAASTITATNLNLGANSTLSLTLSSVLNPTCTATNFNVQGPVTLKVIGAGIALGQYPLIKYSAIGGDGYNGLTLGLPSRVEGYLSNNLAGSIDLVITNISAAKWNGNVNGDWDINSTTNWTDLQTSASTTYLEPSVPGDSVLFDDTASGTTVNLTTNLSPRVLTVTNSTHTYIFSGPGALSGPATFTKSGSGTLVLTNSGVNDFSGAVTINDGTLRLGLAANRLPVAADVTLADAAGAALELGDQDQTLRSFSGGGSNGGNVSLGSGSLTTTASGAYWGVISGSGMLRIASSGTQTLGGANTYYGGTRINGGTLTLVNTNGSGVGSGPVEIAVGTLSLGNGGPGGMIAAAVAITNNGNVTFNTSQDITMVSPISGSGSVSKGSTNTVSLTAPNTYAGITEIFGGALRLSDATSLGSVTGATSIYEIPDARIELLGGITVSERFTLSMKGLTAGLVAGVVNLSGTNTLAGQITGIPGGSFWSLRSDAGKLIVTAPFVHNAGTGERYLRLFGPGQGDWATTLPTSGTASTGIQKDGAGTWTISAVNTYNGQTRANGGVLVVNGKIQSTASVIVGDPTNSVSAWLAGTGSISGPVTVKANGILAPGASIGTMTINNVLTLSGGTEMEISPPAADKITGLTGIVLGGTLKVILTGTVTTNDFFKLFEAPVGTYSGNFANYDLPALPPPLAWDCSTMPVDGTLRVTNTLYIATFGRTSDGNFQLSGTGPDGAAYRVLATTNVILPLLDWTEIGNGSFSGGGFSFTDLNATNYPGRFYRVITP